MYICSCYIFVRDLDSMCMLRHHVLTVTGKGRHHCTQSIKSQNRGSAVWLKLKDDKNLHCGTCYWVTFNQSWSHGSGNHSQLA